MATKRSKRVANLRLRPGQSNATVDRAIQALIDSVSSMVPLMPNDQIDVHIYLGKESTGFDYVAKLRMVTIDLKRS